MSTFSIWDYFRKIISQDDKKAECLICEKKLNYASTAYNLRSHLMRRHAGEVKMPLSPSKPRRKSRENNSIVWLLFTRLENENKIAVCNICDKRCSFKTTTTNLKSHFQRSHPEQYKKILSCFETEPDDSDEENDGVYLKLENCDGNTSHRGSVRGPTMIMQRRSGGPWIDLYSDLYFPSQSGLWHGYNHNGVITGNNLLNPSEAF